MPVPRRAFPCSCRVARLAIYTRKAQSSGTPNPDRTDDGRTKLNTTVVRVRFIYEYGVGVSHTRPCEPSNSSRRQRKILTNHDTRRHRVVRRSCDRTPRHATTRRPVQQTKTRRDATGLAWRSRRASAERGCCVTTCLSFLGTLNIFARRSSR